MTDATRSQPSSPQQHHIKRAAVTYGRRRSPQDDGETSSTVVASSDPPRHKAESVVYSADEDLPPSSLEVSPIKPSKLGVNDVEDTDDEESEDDTRPVFQFAWRQKLQEFDQMHEDAEIETQGQGDVLGVEEPEGTTAYAAPDAVPIETELPEDSSRARNASPLTSDGHDASVCFMSS